MQASSVTGEEQKSATRLTFKDNIELEDFVRLQPDRQFQYRIKSSQYKDKLTPKVPHVFTSNDKLRRLPLSVVNREGFWLKLFLNGSGQPIAREHATLMPFVENGQLCLYLFGGAPMVTGQFNFEIYKINTVKQTWTRLEYERPIVQTQGSRPLYLHDPAKNSFKLFYFSGMVPLQRINSGVKVCPPDMHRFSSESMRWSRIKCQSQASA